MTTRVGNKPTMDISAFVNQEAFTRDWTFDITRKSYVDGQPVRVEVNGRQENHPDSDIVQIRGEQSGFVYYEISDHDAWRAKVDGKWMDVSFVDPIVDLYTPLFGKPDRGWYVAHEFMDSLKVLKLPSFTLDKAMELETSFFVEEDHGSDEDLLRVFGYRTGFCFGEASSHKEAEGIRDNFKDMKLSASEKTLQVHSIKNIGKFSVRSELHVGDCGSVRSTPALKGPWTAYTVKKDMASHWGNWGVRNAVLVSLSKSFKPEDTDTWTEFGIVGVDSGMVTLSNKIVDDNEDCEEGELRGGVKCSAGMGDGGYLDGLNEMGEPIKAIRPRKRLSSIDLENRREREAEKRLRDSGFDLG
jgi:hypothetical protein